MALEDHEVEVVVKESVMTYIDTDPLRKEYFLQCLRRIVRHKGENVILKLYLRRLGYYCLKLGVFERAGLKLVLSKGGITASHAHSLSNDTDIRLGKDHKHVFFDKCYGKEFEDEIEIEKLLTKPEDIDKLMFIEVRSNIVRRKEFKHLKETN